MCKVLTFLTKKIQKNLFQLKLVAFFMVDFFSIEFSSHAFKNKISLSPGTHIFWKT